MKTDRQLRRMDIPEQFAHYLDEDGRNLVIYHNHSEEASSNVKVVIRRIYGILREAELYTA